MAIKKKNAAVFSLCVAGVVAMAALVAFGLETPDFDQGAPVAPFLKEARARAAAGPAAAAAPAEDSLWVSVGSSDLSALEAAAFPLGTAVRSGSRASVYRIASKRLPELSEFMHRRFKRCGGFFAHRSRAEAEEDLKAPPRALGQAYTLDQQDWVRPAVARVKEGEIRSTIDSLTGFHNRYYTAETGVEAARWIAGRWQALAAGMPGAKAELVSHAGWKQPSAVLTIPGSDQADEIVVLGGHLDSINGWWGGETARAPGADDNASGIAVLTEAIRVLGEAGFRPRKTVQFMGYAAEEVGLRGSADIAKRYQREGKKVVGVIQFDMTNFPGSGNQVFLLTDNVEPGLTAFLGKLVDAYAGVRWANTKCGYGCSDHASWTKAGFAASAAFESAFDTMNKNLHTDHDDLAHAGGDAAHSAPFARLAAAFAAELAKVAPGTTGSAR